ncbi:MAG: arsenite methyltransferase [Chloroflexia bacterium]
MSGTAIKEQVRERYAAAARRASEQANGCGCGPSCCSPAQPLAEVRAATSCCGDSCCGDTAPAVDPMAQRGYRAAELAGLPPLAVGASLGCGNPTALIDLRPGETVLDLGSGGGIDVLLSARRVGPTGRAIGLDMTDAMLAMARRNAAEAGVANVEFLKGEIEAIPLPDASVDVVISNCVINLSPDKGAVLREVARVLRPGGRFAVSDIVAQGAPVPEAMRADMESWSSCVAGALHEDDYRTLLGAAGLAGAEIVVTGAVEDAGEADSCCGSTAYPGGRFVSAFIRAEKPMR